jgi:hypothetical protein
MIYVAVFDEFRIFRDQSMKYPMNGRIFFHFLVLIVILGFASSAKSQLYVGLGYQQGFWSMKNANVPIDRFNSKGFLVKNYGKFHWPGGEIYSLSYRDEDGLLLELSLNSRRQRITAKSFGGNVLNQRDIRFSMQAISAGGGGALVNNETFVMYLAGSADYGAMRILTRLAPEASISNVPYGEIQRRSMLAVSLYLKMVFRGSPESLAVVSLTPYVQYPFQKFDFVYLNRLINPQDWNLDPDPLLARPINAGIQFNVDLDLLGFISN